MRGGISGPAVIPKDGENSPLLRRLLALDQPSMPLGGDALPPEAIDLVRAWIENLDVAPAATISTRHWAYVKPRPPVPPEVRDPAWIRNSIDRFVLARLEAEGLSPSAEAAKETLIRRLSLDLDRAAADDRGSGRVPFRRKCFRLRKGSSTDCSLHPTTASGGRTPGWISPATRTRTATRRTTRERCGSTATG